MDVAAHNQRIASALFRAGLLDEPSIRQALEAAQGKDVGAFLVRAGRVRQEDLQRVLKEVPTRDGPRLVLCGERVEVGMSQDLQVVRLGPDKAPHVVLAHHEFEERQKPEWTPRGVAAYAFQGDRVLRKPTAAHELTDPPSEFGTSAAIAPRSGSCSSTTRGRSGRTCSSSIGAPST